MPSNTRVNPYTIVFSLYGQYVLPRGGEIWIGSLIQALGSLGISAGAVRTLASRMQHKGYLQSRRLGRRSFYRLTDQGLRQVRGGGDRAFVPSGEEWDGQWTVLSYTIPEKYRKRRDTLRDWLMWWGFGALAPGTWICPHPFSPAMEAKLRELKVWEYVQVFRGGHLGSSERSDLIANAWPQLSVLRTRYQTYVAEYEPVLRRVEAGDLDDKACFIARLQSLYEFIAITLEDPTLPSGLLPEDWPRPAARSLYKELHQALAEPAERFFDTIFERRV